MSLQTNRYDSNKKLMNFIRTGERVKTIHKKKTSVLSSASGGQMVVDRGQAARIPSENNGDSPTSGHDYLFGRQNASEPC